jgi:CDP-diacylglycerol---glycerol-3-phosphate 3-phosphatidyltransferase
MTIPNQLTTLRIILTPVFLYLLFQDSATEKQIALIVFLIAALTDWYDGMIARRFGYQSEWGRFLDPLADKILTSAAFIGFVIIGLAPLWMVVLIVLRDIFITLLRGYSEFKGKAFFPSKGAKIKTTVQMIVLYYLLVLYVAKYSPTVHGLIPGTIDALLEPTLVSILLLTVTFLTVWTGVIYLFDNRKLITDLYATSRKSTEAN